MRRLVAAVAVLLAGLGSAGVAFAVFRDTSTNTASAQAATLSLSDDDGATAAFALSGLKPTTPAESRCLRVSYTGTASAAVRLFGTTSGALAPYLRLKVERGTAATGTFPSCSGFTADATNYVGSGAGVVYDGALGSYPSTWATGVSDAPGAPEAWTDGETHAYRLTVSLDDQAAGQGQSASAAFTWEARS